MIRELTPEQFTDRLLPIFTDVQARVNYPGEFKPGYFFPHWRRMMELGVARVWEQGPGDAVLGAIFCPNTFTGEKTALVHFWFKRTNAPDATPLLDEATKTAKANGCKFIFSAAYGASGSLMVKYRFMGFEPSEAIFRKSL